MGRFRKLKHLETPIQATRRKFLYYRNLMIIINEDLQDIDVEWEAMDSFLENRIKLRLNEIYEHCFKLRDLNATIKHTGWLIAHQLTRSWAKKHFDIMLKEKISFDITLYKAMERKLVDQLEIIEIHLKE